MCTNEWKTHGPAKINYIYKGFNTKKKFGKLKLAQIDITYFFSEFNSAIEGLLRYGG